MSRSGLFEVLIPNMEEFCGSQPPGGVRRWGREGGGGEELTFCYFAIITMQDVYEWVIEGADLKS